MEENARKRKREEGGDVTEVDKNSAEKPREVLKETRRTAKKQKKGNELAVDSVKPSSSRGNRWVDKVQPGADTSEKSQVDKHREKKERKKAKVQTKSAKLRAKKARKQHETALMDDYVADVNVKKDSREEADAEAWNGDINHIDVSSMASAEVAFAASTVTPSPTPRSPPFDIPNTQSGTSSISSIAPPSIAVECGPADESNKELKNSKASPEELTARLQQRIDQLRAARKADGLDGNPARNRQELMEARRRKEGQRKVHKKELRNKAKEEEERRRELALSRGSPLLSPISVTNAISPRSRDPELTNNFSFARVAFQDGHRMDAALSNIIDPQRRKGPLDPLTAIKATESKQARISHLDEAKRTNITEKELWLNAKKRAQGERIRDDTSLLKKTLKRKEKAKKKSEKEWDERIEGLRKGQAMRQKKRDENIQKRRDEKRMQGRKKRGKGTVQKSKPKARPGFEGSFRTKVPGSGGKNK